MQNNKIVGLTGALDIFPDDLGLAIPAVTLQSRCVLKEMGRTAAETWLNEHITKIGRGSSIDIRKSYL